MQEIVNFDTVRDMIITVRNQQVIVDSDVAKLYGVDQKSLAEKSGTLMTNILGHNLQTTDTETSIELNLALLKVKHTVKRKDKKDKHK